MSLNVEIKALACDSSKLEERIRQFTKCEPILTEQHDVFYHVPKGQLKVRCDKEGECEVIYYYRDKETKGPAVSRYFSKRTNTPESTMAEFQERFGTSVVVNKLRKLFFLDDVRIHLDSVAGLGEFIEIEVACKSMWLRNEAVPKAKRTMVLLGIKETELLSSSYEDMGKAPSK